MFEIKNPKEYGVLYARVAFPKDHRLYWLNHAFTGAMTKDLRDEMFGLADRINDTFKDDIIIPMDRRLMPGCITKPEAIDEIAQAIFDGMEQVYKKLTGDENVIRLVYSVGEMSSDYIENRVKTTHEVGPFPIMVKVGRTLDNEKYVPGIFRV